MEFDLLAEAERTGALQKEGLKRRCRGASGWEAVLQAESSEMLLELAKLGPQVKEQEMDVGPARETEAPEGLPPGAKMSTFHPRWLVSREV